MLTDFHCPKTLKLHKSNIARNYPHTIGNQLGKWAEARVRTDGGSASISVSCLNISWVFVWWHGSKVTGKYALGIV